MLVFVIVAVFVAGLMVGRTPEYLGKKIEAFEMKMAALVILIPPLIVLVGHGGGGRAPTPGSAAVSNPGAARLQRGALRLLVGGQQQRQRLRRAGRQHALLQHRCWALAMLIGALLAGRSRCWRSPGRWPRKKHGAGRAPGTLPTHTPLFVRAAGRPS